MEEYINLMLTNNQTPERGPNLLNEADQAFGGTAFGHLGMKKGKVF